MNTVSDTRQRIINSARELFYARSYADVGVQAICEHARVKKGSFYHFFPSKCDLTLIVLDSLYLEFKTNLLLQAFAKDVPPLQRFTRMVDMVYQHQKQTAENAGQVLGCPFGNLAIEMSTQDEDIRHKIEEIFREFQEIMRNSLQDAVDLGDVGDIDVDATAEAMFAYLEGVLLLAKTGNDVEIIKRLAPAVTQIRIMRQG